MSVNRAAVEALGADYGQWRGLVRSLMNVSFRMLQDGKQGDTRQSKARPVSRVMIFIMLIFGLAIANLAARLPNTFSLSLTALTLVAVTVLYLLLQNFQAVAVTPQDYEVLGHRPVSPRTYLLARLTVIMAQQGILTTLLAGPAVLVCGFRFGWPPALSLLLAACLIVFCSVLLAISTFASVIEKSGGESLARALTWVQVVLVALYMGPLLFQVWARALFEGIGAGPQGWLLALPTVWFAGLASLATGDFTVGAWACLLGVLGSSGGLAWFARDKLSLASAQKFLSMPGTSAKTRSPRRFAVQVRSGRRRPGPASTLAWAQLRRDMRLRMGAIAVPLMCAVYFFVSLRISGPMDPFVPGVNVLSALGLLGVHASVMLAPAVLLEQLYSSESWRAAWIFFATPADRARFAVRMRHFVTLCFFLPYLVLAATGLAWRFEEAWHGVVHALLLGGLAVLIMQVAQFLWPRLPFALPHNRPRSRVPTILTMLGCFALAAALAFYAPFAYQRPVWATGTFVAVALCLAGMERILPARLNRKLRWLESDG